MGAAGCFCAAWYCTWGALPPLVRALGTSASALSPHTIPPLHPSPLRPCREAEARLATAERKVYALTKERDALKRGSDKLSGMDDLVREKDAIIKQVCLVCWCIPLVC